MAEVDAGQVTPVEVVTPPDAQSVPAPDAPTGQEQADESVQPPKTFTEDELRKTVNDRLTKERRRLEKQVRAELERDFYKSQLEQRQPATQPQGEPKPQDFEGQPYENFVRAHARWAAKQELAEFQKQFQQESVEQQRARAVQERDLALARRLHEGATKYPDFQEVVGAEDLPISHAMKAAIERVKNPADVSYYLGSNVAEAERIFSLPDVDQVWEIRELSNKLSTSAPTKAPAPITPNSGTGKAATGYRPGMTDKEFAEWRRRQKSARA